MRTFRFLALVLAAVASSSLRAATPFDTPPLPESFDWTLAPVPVASGVAPRGLSSLRGRTTLLFFFHPECGHCRQEWPHVVAAARRAQASGYQVGAIASGASSRAEIDEFGRELGWAFPIWWDSARAVGQALGIRTVPRAILVRRDGSLAMFRNLDPARIHMVERLARLDAWR
jgi:thiol-disulfide isomerase/thioredoxin